MSLRELLAIERLPVLQNRTFATREAALASPVGDLVLVQDQASGLVFNRAFDPARLKYDAEYQNEQAYSKVFQQHLEAVRLLIDRHFQGLSLAEVGCGKGYFYEMLAARGYDIVGIDPAYEGDNPKIIRAPFEKGLGLSAQALILRHVLEHMTDPLQFLSAIAEANGGRGLIYIEVPCLNWILDHRAWFDLFYEHVNYFRLGDFHRMFGTVLESGHLFGGQYLYVIADLETLRVPRAAPGDRLVVPDDFFGRLEAIASHAAGSGRRAIWGASSKGVLFAVHCARAGIAIDCAIDLNPLKQGRFLPSTGLNIHSPENAMNLLADGDEIVVMNSNYLDEIRTHSLDRFKYSTVDRE